MNREREWVTALIFLAVFTAGLAAVQFSTPNLPDNDGFYHIKLAWLMRTEGLKPEFTWLPYTILNPADFYDHHFLYHVALIPFTFGDLLAGAKWSAVIIPALALVAVWFMLQRLRLPYAWLWALLLLGSSEAFIFRMSITRAQAFSVGILSIGMLWLIEERQWLLMMLGALYVWTYNAFPLLPVLASLHALAVLLAERRFAWRPLAFTAVGVIAGLVINPYFPQNILFTLNHFLPKLAAPAVSGLGNEWFPYDTAQLLRNSLPALIAFASGTLAVGFSGQRMNARTLFTFFAALLFAVMLFNARRFVEYFPPFSVIYAALAWAPLLENQTREKKAPAMDAKPKPQRNLALLIALLVTGGAIFTALSGARTLIGASQPNDQFRGASAWLAENSPGGSLVFQTDWDDFPRLFFYNTHNTYLAGLDPTYLQLYDEELYNQWVAVTRGRVKQPSGMIKQKFGADYVVSDLLHTDFLKMAADDPHIEQVYKDDNSVLLRIVPGD